MHTAIFKMDKQQGPTTKCMKLCSTAMWQPGWEGVLEKWIHVYVWWSHFAVHLKLSQYCLLISCTSIQNKKFKKVLKESS